MAKEVKKTQEKNNKKKAEEKLEQFKIEYEQKSKIQLRDPNIYDKYKNILFSVSFCININF